MTDYPYGVRGERDVRVCALSGVRIRPGDMTLHIEGTKLFYRVAARRAKLLTDEKRAEIESAIKADAGESKTRGMSRKATGGAETPDTGV